MHALKLDIKKQMAPNTVRTGWRGCVAVFRHFTGFKFSLPPEIFHGCPVTSNALCWNVDIL
jgi:hypothetical protein